MELQNARLGCVWVKRLSVRFHSINSKKDYTLNLSSPPMKA